MTDKELLEKWCAVGNIIGDPDFIQVKVLKLYENLSFDAEILSGDDYYDVGSVQTWYYSGSGGWGCENYFSGTIMFMFDEEDEGDDCNGPVFG